MTQNIWMVLLVSLLWIFRICGGEPNHNLKDCLRTTKTLVFVADSFNGFLCAVNPWSQRNTCIIFHQKNETINETSNELPQMETGSDFLHFPNWYTKRDFHMYVLYGSRCNDTAFNFTESDCVFNHTVTDNCQVRCVLTESVCKSSNYDENYCTLLGPQAKDMYIINITETKENCINCDNPVKHPEMKIQLNVSVEIKEGGKIDAAEAVNIMNRMSSLASSINASSAELSVGEGITGVIVKKTDPLDVNEVSFGYVTPNDSISIVTNKESLADFTRFVTVSKEAFEQAVSMNISLFVAVFRFINLSQDALKSTILGNEVLAVEMGTTINNLMDKINISFWNNTFEGTPSCHSWNGEGNQPNWTEDGCDTISEGNNIICQCSHLTFFAILLTPLNETISAYDLNTLTIISQVGCGLSMFFLGLVLFMHCLMRRTKASNATKMLIHLVLAMFLLNFTFLINNSVAKLKSHVGCIVMAAFMHYFMLATFTWFAAQAFHLCLQLYTGGRIEIRHYLLKVSITSWIIPSVVGIVLLIIGKYGQQIIHTDNAADNVAMCWITDSVVHYVVNIGYYALVFLFTFTTFIIILSWLYFLKRSKADTVQTSRDGKSITSILGLCCMLGITWGFAFFAYGVFLIPSYYIFTTLNSFQGFFLFIYYHKTSHSGAKANKYLDSNSNSNSSVVKTSLELSENPYANLPSRKIEPLKTNVHCGEMKSS